MATKPKTKIQTLSAPTGPAWQASHATYLACQSYIDGADALAIEMEKKWGVGRLRLLVSNELREKFDRQRMKFNDAIRTGGVPDVQREAGRMVTAWMVLNDAAEAASKHPLSPEVWEVRLPNGALAALVRSPEEAQAVVRDRRQMAVYTLSEIATLLAGFPSLAKAKECWGGATVTEVRTIGDPLDGMETLNDEIPGFTAGG